MLRSPGSFANFDEAQKRSACEAQVNEEFNQLPHNVLELTILAQPFSRLLLTLFAATSAPDSVLLVLLADAVSESFGLVVDESLYIILPAPPLPT